MSDIKWNEHPQWYSDVIKKAHEQNCPESALIYERMAHLRQRIRELEVALREMLEAEWMVSCDWTTHSKRTDLLDRIEELLETPR